jgi:hypothetical protein
MCAIDDTLKKNVGNEKTTLQTKEIEKCCKTMTGRKMTFNCKLK